MSKKVEAAIEAFKRGEPVVVVDDELAVDVSREADNSARNRLGGDRVSHQVVHVPLDRAGGEARSLRSCCGGSGFEPENRRLETESRRAERGRPEGR